MLLHKVAAARADFTKETLEGARTRAAELTTFSALLPTAESMQALLESLALHALTGSTDQLAACGIAEAIPQTRRLDLHLAHADAFVPFLSLLPSRDSDRTVQKPLPYRSWSLSIERESRSGDRGPCPA